MKDDNIHANHRGSSPPFQEPEQDFIRWLHEIKSIGQRDETPSRMLCAMQPANGKTKSTDLKDDSRWQDDEGESGEVA
jgi:hypothetical protein